MTKRSRIFVAILLIYAAGTAFLLYRVMADLDPRYRESAEESLVESAQLLASLVEQDVRDGAIDTSRLGPLFQSVYGRRFEARIFSVHKNKVEGRFGLTWPYLSENPLTMGALRARFTHFAPARRAAGHCQ